MLPSSKKGVKKPNTCEANGEKAEYKNKDRQLRTAHLKPVCIIETVFGQQKIKFLPDRDEAGEGRTIVSSGDMRRQHKPFRCT